jgi:hypothetical protein
MSDREKNRGSGTDEGKEQSPFQESEEKDGFDDWWEDRSIPQKVLVVIGFVILGGGLLFLFGYVVMLLWNWLMPDIFGLKTLTYWKAWGLLALSCILFGRIGGGGSKTSSSDRKRKRKLRSYLREQYEEEKRKAGCAPE